jgi:hypothetical protein
LRTAFEEVDVVVLEDGFGFDLAVAGGADGEGDIVEEVRAGLRHGQNLIFEVLASLMVAGGFANQRNEN